MSRSATPQRKAVDAACARRRYARALANWGIALFEYLLQVPANRIGHTVMSVGQLKILQEVITLLVFVPFSVYYLREKLTLAWLWAGLCPPESVFFLFAAKLGC